MLGNTEKRTPQCDSLLRYANKLVKARGAQRLTSSEFSYNLLIDLVADDDRCWPKVLDLLPEHLIDELHSFAKDFLEPVDFMPGPEVFIAGPKNTREVEAKKHDLRPRYVSLFDLISHRHLRQN